MKKDVIRVVAAVIERQGRYLITQRSSSAVLPLLWEFPGGRVEAGESDAEALQRELQWRVGAEIKVREKLGDHVHEYESYSVHLALYACTIAPDSKPAPRNVHDLRWVSSAELGDYEFPAADEQTATKLLGLSPGQRRAGSV